MTWAFAIVTATFLWEALGLSSVASLIPLFVLPVTLLILVIELVRTLAAKPPTQVDVTVMTGVPANPAVRTGSGTTQWQTLLWIALLPAMLFLFGLTMGAALFCMVFMKWRSKESWAFSLTAALSMGALIHLLFAAVFKSTLYPGLLGSI